MEIDGDRKVVIITSAGCHALDYLLDGPAEIHAVDVNFRQNALLDLKLAFLRDGSFRTLFEMFGIGSHEHCDEIYRSILSTPTVSQFLRDHPGEYSHFVLLDHQDCLAWHDLDALVEEWELIRRNSRPGTRILMRSAGLDLSFVPEHIQRRLRFQPERTAELHRFDRVGT